MLLLGSVVGFGVFVPQGCVWFWCLHKVIAPKPKVSAGYEGSNVVYRLAISVSLSFTGHQLGCLSLLTIMKGSMWSKGSFSLCYLLSCLLLPRTGVKIQLPHREHKVREVLELLYEF